MQAKRSLRLWLLLTLNSFKFAVVTLIRVTRSFSIMIVLILTLAALFSTAFGCTLLDLVLVIICNIRVHSNLFLIRYILQCVHARLYKFLNIQLLLCLPIIFNQC